jgi:hypothetical protein
MNTKEKMKKKEWVKPQLIVIGKSRPEENVLLSCKQQHHMSGQMVGKYECIPMCHSNVNGICCPNKLTNNS